MANLENLDSIQDQTSDNPDFEEYKRLATNVTVFRERLEKIESNKSNFSEKVFTKVHQEYKGELEAAEEQVNPLREKLSAEIQEFQQKKDEVSVLHSSLVENFEEHELRHIAGEISEDEYQTKKDELDPQLTEIKEKMDILDANVAAYSEMLGQEVPPISEDNTDEAQASEEPSEEAEFSSEESSEPVEGAVEDLDSWQESPAEDTPEEEESFDEDEEETQVEEFPDEENTVEQGPEDFEDEAQDLDQTLEENYDVKVPDEGDQDLEPEADAEEAAAEEAAEAEAETEAEDREGLKPTLVVVEGDTDRSEFEIEGDVITIGRGPDNDIQLANDTSVSRHHSRVTFETAEYIITDLDSSNGTFVNGERVTQIALSENDEISIGQTLLIFKFQ